MKNFYGHSLPSADFKKGSCQLLANEWALLSTDKLPKWLAWDCVARLTDFAGNDLKCVEKPYHCPDVKIKRLKKTLQLSDYSLCIYLIESITLP